MRDAESRAGLGAGPESDLLLHKPPGGSREDPLQLEPYESARI